MQAITAQAAATSSAVVRHSAEPCRTSPPDEMFDGMFDGMFDRMFDGMFDGTFDGMLEPPAAGSSSGAHCSGEAEFLRPHFRQ